MRPVEISTSGEVRYCSPGPRMASPSSWLSADACRAAAEELKPNFAITATRDDDARVISITALTICTHVVASMPPKTT